MNRPPLFFYAVLALLCVWSLLVGCTIESAEAQGTRKAKSPTPAPPKCQQDNKERDIGERFLFNGTEDHYAHVILDPADKRHLRVLADGKMVRDRFDTGSVGPIVFHPLGKRFAFIGAQSGQKYILEYEIGGETPLVAERIASAWKNWVCFGAKGKYLFTIAKYKNTEPWQMFVREERQSAPFAKIVLLGNPSTLELLETRGDGREGFQVNLANDPMQMEIKSWLK